MPTAKKILLPPKDKARELFNLLYNFNKEETKILCNKVIDEIINAGLEDETLATIYWNEVRREVNNIK